MKNKHEILHKIKSFKNNIIEGKKEKSLDKEKEKSKAKKSPINNQNYKTPNIQKQNNLYKNKEHRNSTAIGINSQRTNRYKHLKIIAKNKESSSNGFCSNTKIKNNINSNINDNLYSSEKMSCKSNPKNLKQTKMGINKRNNSSNNIFIVRNKSIDNMTKTMVIKNNQNFNKKNNKSYTTKIKSFKQNIVNINDNNKNNQIGQNNQFHVIHDIIVQSNLANNYKFKNCNDYNLYRINNHFESITNGNINNNTFNEKKHLSNKIDFSNRNRKNSSRKSKTKIMPKEILYKNQILDYNNNITHNIFRTNKSTSKEKISKKYNADIQDMLLLNDKNEFQRNKSRPKLNKPPKKNENEKIENNTIKNQLKNKKNNQDLNTISTTKKKNNLPYQYLILKGNASYLVKYCMYHRINWVEGDVPDPDNSKIFNFKWKELSYGIDYFNLNKNPKMKQMVNHFEYHYSISNKANLFINLMKYCEKNNLSVFKYVPFTIVFKIKDKRKIKNKAKQKRWMDKLEKLKNFIHRIDTKVKKYDEIGSYYNNEEYIKDKIKRDEFELMKIQKKKNKKEEEKNSNSNININNGNIYKDKIEDEKYKGQFEVYSDVFPRLKRVDKNKNKELTDISIYKPIDKEKEKEKKAGRIIGSNTLIEIPDTHYQGKNMWVLKAVNLNRGMCIKVVNSFQQMEKVINKFKAGVDYSSFTLEKIEEQHNDDNNENLDKLNEEEKIQNQVIDNKLYFDKNKKDIEKDEDKLYAEDKEERLYNCNKILIQKYIESPLLYKNRKCDMRIWVLLTHDMKVYFFKEGHLKTCSVQYDLNSEDAFTHITNYSFQKYNSNFQKFEKGNEVPFYEFQKFIDEKYPEKNYQIKKDLMKQIKDIIKVTMLCIKNKINKFNRNYQFEIFGYDFMMDSDFNVFLIEVNFNPGLEISSPWIKIVVPRMLDDALRLTLDKVFEPVYDFSKNYKGEFTPEQKQQLNNSEIKVDFNAVSNNNNNDYMTKDSSSQISAPISKHQSNYSSEKIFNINLELDDFDQHLAKDALTEIEKDKDIINEEKEIKKIKKEDTLKKNKKEENKNKNEDLEIKNHLNKNNTLKDNNNNKRKKQKYISPFPVPGYSLDENLWEFICDLNIKEVKNKNDNNLKNKDVKDTKDKKERNSFTGIKHLLKKKKNKINEN